MQIGPGPGPNFACFKGNDMIKSYTGLEPNVNFHPILLVSGFISKESVKTGLDANYTSQCGLDGNYTNQCALVEIPGGLTIKSLACHVCSITGEASADGAYVPHHLQGLAGE